MRWQDRGPSTTQDNPLRESFCFAQDDNAAALIKFQNSHWLDLAQIGF